MANNDMEYQGGTQRWIEQMARQLEVQGHLIDLYVHTGAIPNGWNRYDPNADYDLALINHHGPFRDLRRASIRTRIVTSHGVIPDEERVCLGADAYVSVSESVRANLPVSSTVIRNPIDGAKFQPRGPVAASLKRGALVSNRQGQARSTIEKACDLGGFDLKVVGREMAVRDPEVIYNWADLVFGIARTAMEALACGRNVFAMDYMGSHGMVTANNFDSMRTHNFGGHAVGTWPTPEELVAEMSTYDSHRNLRDRIIPAQSPETVANEYLALAEQTKPSLVGRVIRRGPLALSSPRVAESLPVLSKFST